MAKSEGRLPQVKATVEPAIEPRWRIYLLGPFHIENAAGPLRLPRRKAESLLAYLLLHPEPHPREHLASLLWGDFPDARALQSLRTAIFILRRTLGADLLLAERHEPVQLNPAFPLWVDIYEISQSNPADIDTLPSKINLYRGELLAGLYDDWITPEREQYRAWYLESLLRLTQTKRARSDYERAIEFARQVLATDPANEQAHQHLMFCYIAAGNRDAARQQYRSCVAALQAELDAPPMPETTALYQWIEHGPSARKAQAAQITNLPIPLTSFIGRQGEMAEIKRLLHPAADPSSREKLTGEKVRLLTLTGAGGSGKTRLSIQVAIDLIDAYQDGVWWVELAALSDGALVPQAVAQALGVKETLDEPLTTTIINFLRSRRLLLILDNCEHLVAACAQFVEAVLSRCAQVQILTTSREPLNLMGELIWPVPPLSTPEPKPLSLTKLLLQYESIRLFVERATAIQPAFALTEANTVAVGEICQQLDGIPLAIELAAARIKVLPVEQIADRLHNRFRLLTSGSRTALPRHQTLRNTIDWSYDLLTEAEQRLFRRLAVFAGGFTLEGVEAIADFGLASTEIENPLDLLGRLVDKSLVLAEPENGTVRYRMLETIRQYAYEKLTAAGELVAARQQHLAFFLQWVEAIESQLRGHGQVQLLSQVETDHDNLRTALDWAEEEGHIEAALRLTGALWNFWLIHDYEHEGLIRAQRLLARLEAIPRTMARAKALHTAGVLAYRLTDLTTASPLLMESIAIAHELGAAGKFILAASLIALGYTMLDIPDLKAARLAAEESLTLGQELGDPWVSGHALLQLGRNAYQQGNYIPAGSRFVAAVEQFQSSGARFMRAVALRNLGVTLYIQEDYATARIQLETCQAIFREVGARRNIADVFLNLGDVALAQGNAGEAEKHYTDCLIIFRELDNKLGLSKALNSLGYLAFQQGNYIRAEMMFKESLILIDKDKFRSAHSLIGLANLALWQGQAERAAQLGGVCERILEAFDWLLLPHWRLLYESVKTTARAELGEVTCGAAWARGRALALPEAVTYALE